jgi:predicted adenine nucleotide alpha hydrolase (AANH) superfamily ATPase
MKLLLHACCAPCSIQCVESLAEEGIRPDLFWYNPNIHPYTEYRSRRDALCFFALEKTLRLYTEDEYGLRPFVKAVSSFEQSDERCLFCYRARLEKTARTAAEKSFDAFSTTLLISPYQNHDAIKEIAEKAAKDFSVEFLYRNFRPRFHAGQKQARDSGYYMQKYCGCIYSEEERYLR